MSAETWALSWTQPWDTALDWVQEDLDRVERQLSDVVGPGSPASLIAPVTLTSPDGGLTVPATLPDGELPEHLGDRARALLARTDELVDRVADELVRTGCELREVAERGHEAAQARRGRRHPAYLDTRA